MWKWNVPKVATDISRSVRNEVDNASRSVRNEVDNAASRASTSLSSVRAPTEELKDAMVAVAATHSSQRKEFDNTDNPAVRNPDWMRRLSEGWKVSMVTVPGTHNTMAFYGGALVCCQTWPLPRQLEAGIRFLDIRIRHFTDGLHIHHGVVYQRASINQVFGDCVGFLDGHQSEFILMRLKKEHTSGENTESFEATLKRHIDAYSRSGERIWTGTHWPTVGEARGKIVILQEFSEPHVGVSYGSMDIDDKYYLPTLFHVPSKWESVRKHLEKARGGDNNTTYLTFASGVGALARPNAVADRINSRLWDFIDGSRNRWGIIAMDFPGAELVQKIIASNFA